ncbi:hypothetical protein [Nocardioides zeae]
MRRHRLPLLDPAERMRRLKRREERRRVGETHDPDATAAFLEWARGYDDPTFDGRSRARHEAWLAERRQPVLRLDSAQEPAALVEEVLRWEPDRR